MHCMSAATHGQCGTAHLQPRNSAGRAIEPQVHVWVPALLASRLGLMHAAQTNDICPSVTVIWLSSISGIQPREWVGRVAAMILDMPNEMSVLVCDLYVAEVIGYSPIGNNQVSARTLPV